MGKQRRAKLAHRITQKRPRGCIYCHGHDKLTIEHVIATRFIDVLAQDSRGLPTPLALTWQDPRSDELRRLVGKTTKKAKPTLAFTANVCRVCNNEWMNQVDDAAWPYVAPMIRGEDSKLDQAAQTAVATWMAKIALTARFSTTAPLPVEQAWTDGLFATRQISPDWYAWIGRYSGSRGLWYFPVDARVQEAEGTPPRVNPNPTRAIMFANGVVATLALGYLVVQLLGFSGEVQLAQAVPDCLQPIWPPSGLVSWPSGEELNDDSLVRVASMPAGARFSLPPS